MNFISTFPLSWTFFFNSKSAGESALGTTQAECTISHCWSRGPHSDSLMELFAHEETPPPPSALPHLRLAAVIGALSATLTFHHTLLTLVIQSKANLLFCFLIIVKWRALNEEEEIMKLAS